MACSIALLKLDFTEMLGTGISIYMGAFGGLGMKQGLSGVWLPSNCSRYIQRGCMTEITGFLSLKLREKT